ncbi:MAG: helix-turn-helix domain-containing protein [Cytophagales bacterium]|nr:helix-turn-helix domain-containing protein [Cytophagales bacterium]
MKIDVQNLFVFIGLIQCLLIILFVLGSKRSISNLLFGTLLFLLGLSSANSLVFFPSGNGHITSVLDFVYPELIMLFGPVTFFYTRSLFEKGFNLKKKDYLHFTPAILDLAPSVFAFMIWSIGLDTIPEDSSRHDYYYLLDNINQILGYPQLLSITIYLFFSWKYLLANRAIADTNTYRWARDILIGMSLIDLIWSPYVIFAFTEIQLSLMKYVFLHPVLYAISAFFYFVTYRLIVGGMSHRANLATKEELEKYRSTILKTLAQDRLYSQTDLNLKMLSQYTAIREEQLSFIFKHYYQKGFNQFINEYRIEKAIEKMENGESDRLSIEGIGIEVGFSSRTTFYRSFKRKTGKSPAELLKS